MAKERIQEQRVPEEGFVWVDRLWSWFVSMRTGLWLLGVIALLSIIGTLIPQEDLGREANPIFRFLGFYDVYHTFWFRGILGLLCINITLCTLQRFPQLWRDTVAVPPMPKRDALKYLAIAERHKTAGKAENAAEKVSEALRDAGYRVEQYAGQTNCLYVDRGRLAPWGTLMVHLSLLVIVCGALYGNFRGFSTVVTIPVGESYAFSRQQYPIDKNFALFVNDFQTQYYQDGGIADWISNVSVLVNNQEVARKELKVNHPLDFDGVRVYQSSYGQAINMTVLDTAGEAVHTESVAEGDMLGVPGGAGLVIRPVRYIPDFDPTRPMTSKSSHPNNPRILYIAYDKGKELDWGAASFGEAIKLKDRGSVIFNKMVPFTGLQVKRDPGFPIVLAGFILMTVGFFISLYTRYIQLWFAFTPQGEATLVEWGSKHLRAQLEVEKIRELLAATLPAARKE